MEVMRTALLAACGWRQEKWALLPRAMNKINKLAIFVGESWGARRYNPV
jgi:hypothetical protein